jgi:hypothetical protein
VQQLFGPLQLGFAPCQAGSRGLGGGGVLGFAGGAVFVEAGHLSTAKGAMHSGANQKERETERENERLKTKHSASLVRIYIYIFFFLFF